MFRRKITVICAVFLVFLFLTARAVLAGQSAGSATARADNRSQPKAAGKRVSLAPRFSPGQTYRYRVVFGTTTAVSRNGFTSDPQGPSSEGVTWNAALRFDVLPAEPLNTGVRLRMVYEKSAADIRSDTFDPTAAETQDQYKKLEGKSIEFAFSAAGKLTGITGLEDTLDTETAMQSAKQWITQFVSGPGAPAGGVAVGQKWTTNQSADSLPVTGLAWRTASQYVRNEPCPAASSIGESAAGESGLTTASPDICAVIVSDMTLLQPKSGPERDPTPDTLLKNGMHTSGTWHGSAHTESYISLRNGLVVSIAQSGNEAMDVTFITSHLESLRYAGTIKSQSSISLESPSNP